jgi:hypothetical protein
MLKRTPRAGWPAPQDVECVLKTVGRPATEQIIRDILKRIDPPEPARAECLQHVLDDLRRIAGTTVFDPPGKVKRKYAAIETAARNLRAKIMHLQDHRNSRLLDAFGGEQFIDELVRLEAWCSDRAGNIKVEHAGGERINSGKLVVAAVFAFELLQQFGRYPAGERYSALTSLLFEAATGKKRDCKNICAEILRARRQR